VTTVAIPGDMVWNADSTAPDEIASTLRRLLGECHAHCSGSVPARVLNLVCVVDKTMSGAVSERLRQTGGYHASRTIICAVDPSRGAIGAEVMIGRAQTRRRGDFALLREWITLAVGQRHVSHLDTIVDPLVVSDLPTVVWCAGRHDDSVRALLPLAQAVLLDSSERRHPRLALRHARELLRRAHVVDLDWLRSTPWRERVAAAFDPPAVRPDLSSISAVTVRHHPESATAGLLLVGWLASRLEWRVSPLGRQGCELVGTVGGARGDVRVTLMPDRRQSVHGLSGLTLEASSGRRLSLDRGRGGLQACERDPGGRERRWKVAGAGRGEPGILGEGIRQALLRDPAFAPAVCVAATLAPSSSRRRAALPG
jgi:glucose-6-phosphate dehydrogenase assembly protein OpcA